MRVDGDYQQYDLDASGAVVWAGLRMQAKAEALRATGLAPDFCAGRSVLELGCDHGFWSFLASSAGARQVLALDRNRDVKGRGPVDLIAENTARARQFPMHDRVHFREINLGKQWHEFGLFDIVLVCSVYHHVYAQCGSHHSIWFWLARHIAPGGLVIWEGPVGDQDPVIRKDVPPGLRSNYTAVAIERGARQFFDIVSRGPALHEPTRQIWICRRKEVDVGSSITEFRMLDGAKGASKAFARLGGQRMDEIGDILGVRPIPGSLNLELREPFDWSRRFYRAQILDSTNRGDPNAPWAPRWCRFYPVAVGDVGCWAMRFEGEHYPEWFVEVIAPYRLRDLVEDPDTIEVDGFTWPKQGSGPAQIALTEVKALDDVLAHVPGRSVAVQAGGNVGVFPARLAREFGRVYTFEPDAHNFGCLERNVPQAHVSKHRAFLGDSLGTAGLMRAPANTGAHWQAGEGTIPVMTIDGLNLKACDFICLDVEGSELQALLGASQTIARCRPVIMLEDTGLCLRYDVMPGAAKAWLARTHNYRMVARTKNDVVMAPCAGDLRLHREVRHA